MSERHPTLDEIARFLDDDLDTEESRALQRHLFTCPRCEERMIALLPGAGLADEGKDGELEAWMLGPEPSPLDRGIEPESGIAPGPAAGPEYGGLVRRVLAQSRPDMARRESRLHRERSESFELWHELAGKAPGERLECVRAGRRFQSWGFFELLLELALDAIFEDPKSARERLELALGVAEHLDPGRYGPGSVEAARARAWAYLGNAQRVLADFRLAEEAFERAEDHLSRSWLDPLDEALILELKSSLRRAQRRFEEAMALLDDAVNLYREVNEPQLQGRALISKGLVLLYASEIEPSMSCLRNGLFLIDPAEEPRLVIVAQQNLIYCLNDSGRAVEARSLIDDARPLWRQVGRRLDLVRLRWLEGKVESNLGHLDQAEEAFLEVRAAFLADDIAYDVALVSLDLAAIYARQGRAAETKRLSAEMLPIFRARDVHREAIAALLFFQRAAEMEQLTLSVVDEIAAYLERARGNPELKFRAGDAGDPGNPGKMPRGAAPRPRA